MPHTITKLITTLYLCATMLISQAQETTTNNISIPKMIAPIPDESKIMPNDAPETLPYQALSPAEQRFQVGMGHLLSNNNLEAITVFSKLIEDFPNLREPYNNLAIVYARLGEYDKSRAALTLMLRNHPDYQNGYETLGDIYIQMAHENYRKVIRLNANSPTARNKITLIDSMRAQKTNVNTNQKSNLPLE